VAIGRTSDLFDAYEVLGVGEAAALDEIEARFRILAARYHPDRADAADRHLLEESFKRVSAARDALRDPVRRARIDTARAAARLEAARRAPRGGQEAAGTRGPQRSDAPPASTPVRRPSSPSAVDSPRPAAPSTPAAVPGWPPPRDGDPVANHVEDIVLPAMTAALRAGRYREVTTLYGRHVARLNDVMNPMSRRSYLWGRGADLCNAAQLRGG
jgi:curved DNA-binding protein CbpA